MTHDFSYYFRFFIKLYLLCIVTIGAAMLAVSQGWLGELPSLEYIKNPQKQLASVILSEDFEEMGKLYYENRTELNYTQIAPSTIQALIATEDIRYYDHSGIDVYGLASAVMRTFMAKKSGASTITQQLAKNLFHGTGRSNIAIRGIQKLKEWYIAVELERNFSKQEILALYLNTVPFLHNSFGIREASQTYFSKEPIHLTVDESAVLIGMLKGPALYNPKTKPENALKRRNVVIDQMLKSGFINEKTAKGIKELPIRLRYKLTSPNTGLAPYLREEIRMELDQILSKYAKADGTPYNIYTDGLKIHTTINSKMQIYAEESVREHMVWLQKTFLSEWKGRDPYRFGSKKNPDLVRNIVKEMEIYKQMESDGLSEKEIFNKLQSEKRSMRIFTWNGPRDTTMSIIDSIKYMKNILQVGFCSMEPNTGRIRAWVGGIDFNQFKLDHVRKSTKRQVGSTIKPLLYSLALDQGMTPCSTIDYLAPQIPGHESWNPKGTKYFAEGSQVTLKDALQVSDNRIAAQLIKAISPQALIERAEQLGIQADFEPVPAICLGTTDISVYEMIGAYSPFMNYGIYSEPFYIERIEDHNGNLIYQNRPVAKEAIDENTAVQMNKMMQLVSQGRGTATRLRSAYGLKMDIACKTGTTQSNSDGWFIGSTPKLLTAVWVGADDPSITFASTGLGQGASSALPIWAKYYKKVYADKTLHMSNTERFFPVSDTATEAGVDALNCDELPGAPIPGPIDDQPSDVIIPTQIEDEESEKN